MKREPTIWENVFANDTSDKGLVSKIYKQLTGLHSRNTKTKLQRETTVWENIFANDTSDKGLISKIYEELT